MPPKALLKVQGLRVAFHSDRGALPAVDGVDFMIGAGRSLTIVGESGAGKSQLALAVLGLAAPEAQISGQVWFEGCQLLSASPRTLRALRGSAIGMVFQDPSLALAPHLTIGRQLTEVLAAHHAGHLTKQQASEQAFAGLCEVRLSEPTRRLMQYPHELSGGMLQRVMWAIALIGNPRLLILDEPTSALDASSRRDLLALLSLVRARGTSVLCITHDLDVAAHLGDEVAVMLSGQFVEVGPASDVLRNPVHPYTRALLASRVTLTTPRHVAIPTLPEGAEQPEAKCCVFAMRCPFATGVCQSPVPMTSIGPVGVRCRQPWQESAL